MREQNSEEPLRYIIRYYEYARRDIDAAYVWIAETVSLEIADQWLTELNAALAGLSQFPRRCSLAPEKFRSEVRRLLYSRHGSQTTHWIFFILENEDVSAEDPPTVTILHVRHTYAVR